jgi:hypothetical protein
MTRNGMAYALPTSAPRTADTGSSLLLPTPEANTASNGGSQHPDKRRSGGHSVNLQDVAEHLLPTPTSRDHKGANQRGDTTCLTGALLPTPRATRGGSATETVALLPTPTATPYGNNQSLGPNATVRPSLDTLFNGDSTNLRSADGSEPSDG